MILTYILLIIVVVLGVLVATNSLRDEKAFKLFVLLILALMLVNQAGWLNLK